MIRSDGGSATAYRVGDARLERLYEEVELVRGAGRRGPRRLCVMSFVALLSGEGHGDCPDAASRVIRALVIPINDGLPATMRQSLKAFVPCIVGTADGRDALRGRLLLDLARDEVLPRIGRDFANTPVSRVRRWPLLFRGPDLPHLHRTVAALCDNVGAVERQDAWEGAAHAVGLLICASARTARNPDIAAWYWLKAIDLVDRVCGIDAGAQGHRIMVDWTAMAERRFNARAATRAATVSAGQAAPAISAGANQWSP